MVHRAFCNHKPNQKYIQGWFSLKDLPAIRTDLPPKIYYKDGAINSVLAKSKTEDTHYLSHIHMCNTEYYNLHSDEYLGWYEVEGG